MFELEPFDRHVKMVTTVAAVVEPPTEWRELLRRFAAFVDMSGTAAERLCAAVVAGDDDAVFMLRTLALAEAAGEKQPQVVASLVNQVRSAVFDRLQAVYSEHADNIYAAVADGFDSIAAKFTTAAKQADPEAAAEEIVTAAAKARTAWSEAPMLAAQLDGTLPALDAAARLCGATGPDALTLLPLTIDPEGHHRRVTWEAFKSTGRAGRWSAVVAAGIPIRAARDPRSVEPYRLCRDYVERTETVDGTTRVIWDDPEDPGYKEPEPPFVYRRGAFVG